MLNYLCDSCGKLGYINPKTEPKMEKQTYIHEGQKIEYTVPATRMVKRQNALTGLMEEMPEAIVEYKQERIIRVYLELGPNERIAREFCTACFEKVKADVKSAWDTLESYDPI